MFATYCFLWYRAIHVLMIFLTLEHFFPSARGATDLSCCFSNESLLDYYLHIPRRFVPASPGREAADCARRVGEESLHS